MRLVKVWEESNVTRKWRDGGNGETGEIEILCDIEILANIVERIGNCLRKVEAHLEDWEWRERLEEIEGIGKV